MKLWRDAWSWGASEGWMVYDDLRVVCSRIVFYCMGNVLKCAYTVFNNVRVSRAARRASQPDHRGRDWNRPEGGGVLAQAPLAGIRSIYRGYTPAILLPLFFDACWHLEPRLARLLCLYPASLARPGSRWELRGL